MEGGCPIWHEPQCGAHQVLQMWNSEHAAQQLYGHQRGLGKMKIAVLKAVVRENRQLFSSKKNLAIDEMATDDFVVVQIDCQTCECFV